LQAFSFVLHFYRFHLHLKKLLSNEKIQAGQPRKLTIQGNPAAQSNVALMYAKGQGVSKDYVEAYKWSALSAIGGLIVLSAGWEVARRRRAGVRRPFVDAAAAEGFGLVLAFLLVPALAYLTSYVGWFLHFGWSLGAWARLQGAIASYHEHLQKIDPATGQPVHPYLADAWKWLLLLRPVLYYGRYVGDIRRVIYANGNPAIFWGSLLAIPYTAWAWWRDRDWRAGFILVAIASQYLPWFLISRPEFFFYVLPIVPFLVLADVFALRRLSAISFEGLRSVEGSRRVRPFVPLAVVFVVLAVGLFVWFYPTLTGGPLSPSAWLKRAWFPSWTYIARGVARRSVGCGTAWRRPSTASSRWTTASGSRRRPITPTATARIRRSSRRCPTARTT